MLKIKVPASTSNFGSGFDAFGLALSLYNEFYVEPSGSYNVQIEGEGSNLPTDEENLFIKVYKRACKTLGKEEVPISLKQINRVPTARGLGSSATAIVGGIEGIYQGRKHLHKAYRVYARAFFLYPLEEHPLLIYPVEPVPFYNAV